MRNSRPLRLGVGLGSAGVLLWPVVGYPATLALLARARRRAPSPSSKGALPRLTVIVPTFQEESFIERRLENLLDADYPDDLLRILVIDSASGDATAARVRAFAARHPAASIRVIEERVRSGKAAAINIGIAAAETDLILLTDAPTEFAPDAIRLVVRCFDDPDVGAATGYFDVDGERGRVADNEAAFWRMRNRLRTLEASVDSTPFITGELCCFRKSLVAAIDENSLADDMNVVVRVRRQGARVVVENQARFREPRSNDARELLRTKSRRAAGGVQELVRARDLLLKPRYGLFGMLILPSAWLYYLPTRLPAALAFGWAVRVKRRPARGVLPGLVLGAAAAAALPGVRRRIWSDVTLIAFNEAVLVAGWQRVAAGHMDVRWSQERSTRLDSQRRTQDTAG